MGLRPGEGLKAAASSTNLFSLEEESKKKHQQPTRCTRSRGNQIHRVGSKERRTRFLLLLRDPKCWDEPSGRSGYIRPVFYNGSEGRNSHLQQPGSRKLVMQPTPMDPRKCLLTDGCFGYAGDQLQTIIRFHPCFSLSLLSSQLSSLLNPPRTKIMSENKNWERKNSFTSE